LGSIPFMGETEAMEAVEAASAAYNKDRDYGQLWKWWIVSNAWKILLLKWKRLVKRLLNFDVGNR
jgi:hypothetical protein